LLNLHATSTIGAIPEDDGDYENNGASPVKSLTFTESVRK
jgi:hypothetical protein